MILTRDCIFGGVRRLVKVRCEHLVFCTGAKPLEIDGWLGGLLTDEMNRTLETDDHFHYSVKCRMSDHEQVKSFMVICSRGDEWLTSTALSCSRSLPTLMAMS